MAPKAYEPTEDARKLVELASAVGLSQIQIAHMLDINKSTLRKHFAEELKNAAAKANAKVAGALYKNAIGGNVSAQIFWCKTRLGWKETERLEHTGEEGGPIKVVFSLKTS